VKLTRPEKWWNTGKRPWQPSIYMPREFSRITLEITDVRVERLQEIEENDALCEGIPPPHDDLWPTEAFHELWDSINAKRGCPWTSNPFVWVLSFRRI
jgi:hypothetical protein